MSKQTVLGWLISNNIASNATIIKIKEVGEQSEVYTKHTLPNAFYEFQGYINLKTKEFFRNGELIGIID